MHKTLMLITLILPIKIITWSTALCKSSKPQALSCIFQPGWVVSVLPSYMNTNKQHTRTLIAFVFDCICSECHHSANTLMGIAHPCCKILIKTLRNMKVGNVQITSAWIKKWLHFGVLLESHPERKDLFPALLCPTLSPPGLHRTSYVFRWIYRHVP